VINRSNTAPSLVAPPMTLFCSQAVSFLFTALDLQGGKKCSHDSVRVYDGLGENAPELLGACGTGLASLPVSQKHSLCENILGARTGEGERVVVRVGRVRVRASRHTYIVHYLLLQVGPSGYPEPALSTTSEGLRVVFQTDAQHEFGGFVAAFSAVALNGGSDPDAISTDSTAEQPVFAQLPSTAEARYGEAAAPASKKSRLVLFVLLGALALVVVAVIVRRCRKSHRKQDRAQAAWMVAGNKGALVVTGGSMGRDDQVGTINLGAPDLSVSAVLTVLGIYALLVCSSSRMSASFSACRARNTVSC
jgi:hypothetical protein